jgi:hypothetical protein
MSTFDDKSANTGLGTGEPELSARELARALEKLGLNFDPETEEGRQRAAEYVNEALSDRAATDAIIAALAGDAVAAVGDASEGAGSPTSPFVPTRIFAGRTPADEFLMDDAPSRGRLLTALERETASAGQYRDRSRLLWVDTGKPAWRPTGDLAVVVDFLSSALLLLPAARPSLLDRMLVKLGRDYPWTPPVCAFTHYLATDSARLIIRFGATNIHLNYRVSRDTLVVAREADGAKGWLLEARPAGGDPAQFSRELLKAFDGHADQARVALDSLRSAVNESSRASV